MPKFSEWSGPARKRLYRMLPLIGALMVAYGVIDQGKAALIIGLIGAAIGPIQGEIAASQVHVEHASTPTSP